MPVPNSMHVLDELSESIRDDGKDMHRERRVQAF